VTVRDEAGPLTGATVYVESRDGRALATGETREEGRFVMDLADAVIDAGVHITAFANGHGAVSFLENVAHRISMELPATPGDSYATLNGRLTGFKDNEDENKGSAGLVAKAMEITDLVQLDSSSFISPLKDTIDLLGPRNIPSNIVLPDQTFPVYFIPIHVNKPTYRLPMLAGSSSRYFGVTGTLLVQDAVNAIRGGSAWDIVNLLEFQKVGVSAPVPPANGGDNVKLDVVADTEIRGVLKLRAGKDTSPGETRRLEVAIWEPTKGLFVPTDVKLAKNEDVTLAVVDPRAPRVLDVLVSKDGDRYRGAWVKGESASIPDAGLTADITVDRLGGTWQVSGGEDAQLLMAHLEAHKKTSVGNGRYDDRWVLVGPRRAQLKIPPVAYANLAGKLGTISHVSVDLLQLGSGGYPFIDGEASGSDLAVLEKVRKEIKTW
jgi:hypothetical protein